MKLVWFCLPSVYILVVYNHALANNVYWEVQSHPVVFGESVTLYCNTTSVQDKCEQCLQIWYGGNNQEILSFNGLPINRLKYEANGDSHGYALIIKLFEERDLQLYSCAFGFYSDKKKLQLTDDFELQPTNETINISQFINGSSVLNVQVDFKKVYPPPRCTVSLNGDNLSSKLIIKQHQEGIFYSMTMGFQYNLKPNYCMGKIQFICTIGTRNTTIISSNFNSTCSDNYTDEQSLPSTTLIVKQSLPSTTDWTETVEQSRPSTTVIVCVVTVPIIIIIIIVSIVVYKCVPNKCNHKGYQKKKSNRKKSLGKSILDKNVPISCQNNLICIQSPDQQSDDSICVPLCGIKSDV